jgi:molecular chaperone HtpG
MDHDDLVDMLGTIARSGSQAFVDGLSGDAEQDQSLIGQFGVGFYSAFMVADEVRVLTRKAGGDGAWLWTSDGKGSFTIEEAERDGPGTTVTVHLAKGEKEFADAVRLGHLVKTYSDHIPIPILLDGETVNEASALWTRAKKGITDDQYKEFYHHVGHAFDDPWMVMHNRVEGVLSYTNLLFIPSTRPFDLYQSERKQRVRLYVKRVFITDDCEDLLPAYLRFMRGIVDSEDLALNISREMLQNDPKLAKIRSGLVKRVLGQLKKKAEKQPDDYAAFWANFGAVLKEGLYEDPPHRDRIMALARFATTGSEGLASLEDYIGRMVPGQDAIYYITGDDPGRLAASPQLEGFRERGVEVLLLTDPIDDFWISAVGDYQDKPFKSVTRGGADLEAFEAKDKGGEDETKKKKKEAPALDGLCAALKDALGDAVKEVRTSSRLTDSPSCLVADEGDMDMHLERLLRQNQQLGGELATPRVLEINPSHSLIKSMNALVGEAKDGDGDLTDSSHLLLDQARIAAGEPVPDPAAFSRRLTAAMESGLKAKG